MSAEKIDVSQAQDRLREVLERVEKTGRPVVLTCAGTEVGALVPMHTYRVLMEEREARHQEFLRAGERMPVYPEEEVERDIAEALAAIRGKGATSPV